MTAPRNGLAELVRLPEVGDRPRVLLVDDERDLREAMRDLLEDLGVAVAGEAGDGAETVEIAPSVNADVILMDLRMPRLDGIEATRRIKEKDDRVQVIVLSAYDDAGLREGAEEAGVYCYLVKGRPPLMIHDMIVKAWEHTGGR